MTDPQTALKRAIAYHQDGQLDQAAELYSAILQHQPRHADALRLSGTLALQAGQPATALEILTVAADVQPADARIHFHLGLAAQQLESLDIARQCYELALTLRPGYRVALENLAVVLRDLGEQRTALDRSREALELTPDSELSLANAGTLAFNLGFDDEAQRYFDRSIALYPCNADIRLKRAQLLLRRGQFAAAWDDYEWRFLAADYLATNAIPALHRPRWINGTGAGRVCVFGEQGIGDELMFATCLRDLANQATAVTLACSEKLVTLLQRSFPDVTVVARDAPVQTDDIEYRLSAGSLPNLFRRDADAFGCGDGFLVVDCGQRERWQRWRDRFRGRRVVGIAWAGGADPAARQARSIPVDALVKCLANEQTVLVSLQYDASATDLATMLPPAFADRVIAVDELDLWDDIDSTAALLSVLDAVVTVDNTLAHLAGALGAPAAVLLPVAAEGRWLSDRADTPWYRSLRLLRQDPARPGDWDSVLQALPSVLADLGASDLAGVPQSAAQPALRASATRQATVLLVNDTAANYHWGCTLTCNGLFGLLGDEGVQRRSLPLASIIEPLTLSALQRQPSLLTDEGLTEWLERQPGLRDLLTGSDLLLVNGEGTLHGSGDQALTLLAVLAAADALFQRPYAIVNHSAYPPTGNDAASTLVRDLYRRVYTRAVDVAVRERFSQAALVELGIDARLTFDCLPLAVPPRHVASANTILIAGTAAASDAIAERLAEFVANATASGYQSAYLYGAAGVPAADDHWLASEVVRRSGAACQLLYAATEQAWLDAIAAAKLLVSGRFHHTIAAACLGTPFLVAGSNTQKVAGVLTELDLVAQSVAWDTLGERSGFDRAEALIREPQPALIEPTLLAGLKQRGRHNIDVVKTWLAEQTG
ncbi:MAG: polysaccharide pyruvyl transferase family protein [Pseudomonadota bacterium]